jgi:acyl carrier protein
MGFGSLAPREALELLGRFIHDERVHVGAMRVDWSRWSALTGGRALSPRFEALVREAESGESSRDKAGEALRSALMAADAAERRNLLQSALVEQLSAVLATTPDALDVEKSLSDLGLDSLMAVELRNWIERDLRLNLPTVELLRGPTIVELSDVILDQLSKLDASRSAPSERVSEPELSRATEPTETQPSAGSDEAIELVAKVDEMSDDQVDAMLEEMARRDPGVPGRK